MSKKSNWTPEEVRVLRDYVGTKTLKEISDLMGKTENAIYLYCYRNNIPLRPQLKNPMMTNLLTIKFGHPEYFHPTKAFFKRVGISQKRWAELSRGYVQPTQDELKRVAMDFNFTAEEIFKLMDSRQLNLFDL